MSIAFSRNGPPHGLPVASIALPVAPPTVLAARCLDGVFVDQDVFDADFRWADADHGGADCGACQFGRNIGGARRDVQVESLTCLGVDLEFTDPVELDFSPTLPGHDVAAVDFVEQKAAVNQFPGHFIVEADMRRAQAVVVEALVGAQQHDARAAVRNGAGAVQRRSVACLMRGATRRDAEQQTGQCERRGHGELVHGPPP